MMIFKVFFPLLIFLTFSNCLEAKSANRITYTQQGLIEEAFVTYATANYFPLVEVLLDSIGAFSSRPIVVFGINADVPFSTEKYPFLIIKRMDLESSSPGIVMYAKPKAILESGVSRGIYVDADIILNDGGDALFDFYKENSPFPFSPVHPSAPDDQESLMSALGVKEKSMQYVHSDLIIFSEETMPFMKEWYQINQNYGHLAPFHDETVLNVLLWKYQITDALPICDPYFMLAYDYLTKETQLHQQHGYSQWIDKINFFTFHGCKDGHEAKKILEQLITRSINEPGYLK